MTMSLYEVVYVSQSSQDMSPHDLAELLDRARLNNMAQGITGIMIYHRRSFMQLLEGERSAVLALYERIAKDTRHRQLRKLWDGPITNRSFADWGMAFFAPNPSTLQQHAGYRELFSRDLTAIASDNMGKQLLMSLKDDLGVVS